MITEFFDLAQWLQWFSSLDRTFIFLLVLPFVVAIIGLWSWWVEREDRESAGRGARAAPPARERRVRERRQDGTGRIPQQEG